MRQVLDILGDLFCLREGKWAGQEMQQTEMPQAVPSGVRAREQAVPNREITCPQRVCARRVSIGVSSIEHSTQLLQCVRCPLALHKAVR